MSRFEDGLLPELSHVFKEAFKGDVIDWDLDDVRYQEFEFYSQGGHKDIYLCLDDRTGRRVAMAKLRQEDLSTKRESFIREARINAALQHPNIVPVYDMGEDDGIPWFTMKFISGKTLHEIIDELINGKDSRFHSLNDRLEIFLKVCDAVAYAHSIGILHLDLKPENIRINHYGDVLVCDWGLADIIPSECDEPLLDLSGFIEQDLKEVTLDGVIKGTPGYLAPEQTTLIKMRKGKHTDVFSLGALLYKILTYKCPFTSGTLKGILEKTARADFVKPRVYTDRLVPISLEAVCVKAMSLKSVDRYESVRDLQKEVRDFINGFVTEAENASLIKLLKTWIKRNKSLALFISFSVILSLGLMLSFVLNLKLEQRSAKMEADKLRIEAEYHKRMNKEAAPRFLEKATMAYNTFEFDDALNFCESTLEINPKLNGAWELKAKVHFVRNEFNLALAAFIKGNQKESKLSVLCQQYIKIKADDASPLILKDYLGLIKKVSNANLVRQFSNLVHYKIYNKMRLEDRIIFCREVLKMHNLRLKELNFSFDKESESLNVAHNPGLRTAICLQNFPAKHVDLSYTNIQNFICFRNQDLDSINVSNTAITEVNGLHNRHLKELDISHTSISNLIRLERIQNLQKINIAHTNVKNLYSIKKMKFLRVLIVHKGQFPKTALTELSNKVQIITVN